MRAWFVSLALGILLGLPAAAQDVVKIPRPPNFVRFAYHYELLEEALKATVAEFGPYVVKPYAETLSTARILREAIAGDHINVLAIDFGSEMLTEGMLPVPLPIDKGLLGYRVSLILAADQERVEQVKSLEDLRSLRVGRGRDWGDVRIFEHNGVPVVTAPVYDTLFVMLSRGRFDLFPRGVTEISGELALFQPQYPELAIERGLIIQYPYAQFFYVSHRASPLVVRIGKGLESMIADGSFDALFQRHFAKALADLRLNERRVIRLENPHVPDWVPFDRKELWFDPKRPN